MRYSPLLLLVFILSLAPSCSSPVSTQTGNDNGNTSTNANSQTPQETSVVLSIPVGGEGINYANTDVEESEPWGPSAISIAPDGTFLIVDTVDNEVLRFRPDGSQMPTIKVDNVVGITDVTANAAHIFVLDESATTPAIVRFTTEGVLEDSQLLTPQLLGGGLRSRESLRSLSGLATAEDGDVLLEFNSGESTRRLDNRAALDSSLRGRRFSVEVPTLQSQLSDGGRGLVLLDGQRFAEVRVENLVAELKILSVNANGDVFVVLDELAALPQVNVDQTVRRYSSNGTLTGVARVPIRESYTYVRHSPGIDRDSQVIALITKKGRNAEVVRLNFRTELVPILPRSTFIQSNANPANACTRTRSQIASMARRYIDNSVPLNITNLDGACEGRRKPRYLKATAGRYSSVAYDWGGAETVESYNAQMAQNRAAGDIDTNGVERCSIGVDCSGFVTRCWGFSDPSVKYGTSTLPSISSEINILELLQGDILNRAGRHVVLFDKLMSDGNGNYVMAWESITTDNADRVVHEKSSWRRFAGYVARRYRQVC
jgi:hypothetical protein